MYRYCECFQCGIHCTEKCRCQDCRNIEGGSGLPSRSAYPYHYDLGMANTSGNINYSQSSSSSAPIVREIDPHLEIFQKIINDDSIHQVLRFSELSDNF